ncbi:hypothetical protein MED297_12150 [Reinekea sp. MED297]|uniref:Uncharacterized protein n=1 Tax=Reinekea blandensis MED297 TaxID=314283 RepID=A4BBF5_9GAMM|nr:hypothetical protein MED297_12150 [Reinekea sp. MED297] [Reinekea blandensis MED297]
MDMLLSCSTRRKGGDFIAIGDHLRHFPCNWKPFEINYLLNRVNICLQTSVKVVDFIVMLSMFWFLAP